MAASLRDYAANLPPQYVSFDGATGACFARARSRNQLPRTGWGISGRSLLMATDRQLTTALALIELIAKPAPFCPSILIETIGRHMLR